MSSTMEYKGYIGSVEFSEADGLFYGKVQGIRSLISYEGTTAKELVGSTESEFLECAASVPELHNVCFGTHLQMCEVHI